MTTNPAAALVPDAAEMKDRYQRAAVIAQGLGTKSLVRNETVFPQWIGTTDFFWYEHNEKLEGGRIGKKYRLVDARTGSSQPAFDHAALADALSIATGKFIDAESLPIHKVEISVSPLTVCFEAIGKPWQFDSTTNYCKTRETHPSDWVVSPNEQLAIFSQDNNLWVKDINSYEERALTDDGEEFFVYGAVGTAWGCPASSGLQVLWSPDSKRIFTVQRDTRQVKTLPVMRYVPGDSLRPTVIENRVALPGDTNVENYRLLTIDVTTGEACEAHYRRIPTCRNGWGFFNAPLGWWAKDSQHAYFIDQTRGDQIVRLVEFDTYSGATRIVFEETSDTHVNLSLNSEDNPPHIYLPETNELIWFSERSGWAHLYLYDLDSGSLKHTITQGEWLVRRVLHFSIERRELIIQTAGRVAERDPYYCDIARVHVDTGEISTLISTDHEYVVHTPKSVIFHVAQSTDWDIADTVHGVSASGDYIVTTRSRADQVPVSLLLNRDGVVVCELETADITALPTCWQWPEPVKLTAADDKTDIYGLVHRPSHFDANKSYPVINFVMNGPDVLSVSKGSFINNEAQVGINYLGASALAELGFIVVVIDSRGTPLRSKAFVDESYGWIPDSAQTDDHVEAIHQLAARYPFMDLNNVGVVSMYGVTGGLHSLFERPDFYKVGVVTCPQDSRLMGGPVWGEKYEGLSGPDKEHCYPEDMVENFEGKLLLMHGMLDTVSTPATTFRLVEALHKANKDFEMFLLPNVGHDASPFIRRCWDYLVRHMLAVEPPKAFEMATRRLGIESMHEL